MRRLMAAEAARRSTRVVRRASAGQTLIIFALTFTVLIGFMGLAIDSIRVYDLYARMQRAAEAGALAGVIYMPNNYTTNVPVTLSNGAASNAICEAEQLVNKNNFGPPHCQDSSNTPTINCTTPSAQEVAVCPVRDTNNILQPYQLQVFITEPINVLFLSALNVGPLTITASAIAAYLPPVNIASDPTGTGSTGSWGSFGECGKTGSSASAACTGTSSVRNWAGNINGPGELKEQGDPLVTCSEGADGPAGIDQDASVTPLQNTTYTGLPTNHPQTDGLNPGDLPNSCGNPDTQGAFTGPDYTGSGSLQRVGYAYLVSIPTAAQGGTNQSLWIWNAPFSPQTPKNCNGRTGGQSTSSYDIFYEYNCKGSGGSTYPYYPGVNQCGANPINPYTCLDPKLYFTVSYSIYKMANLTDITGTLQATYTALPYAGTQSCGNGQFEAVGGSTVGAFNSLLPISTCEPSPCVSNWCPLQNQIGDLAGVPTCTGVGTDPCDLLPGNYYRIVVVASDYGDPINQHLGWGGHSYSLKLCPAGTTTQSNVQKCTPGGALGGWNVSDAVLIFPGGGGSNPQITEYPLGVIDPSFAGRTLDVQLYDPGDLNGNNGAATGATFYAVAPPTAAADPCNPSATDLTNAGYTTSNFYFPPAERAYTANNAIVLNTLPAMEPANNGDLIYNGLWVDEQVKVPSTYSSSATWTLCAEAPQTNDADVVAIGVFALGQSPVHLVQ